MELVNKSPEIKNKLILKNTVVLYIRSFVIMLISLYSSRVILHSLGISDYGLYNVVGGVVAFFSFFRTTMTKCTQRFLNVEMVEKKYDLRVVFSTSLNIHLFIGLIMLLVTETLGLWFLNVYIQIPIGREFAANIVYQTTIISLILTIISVPYNADIIAHEEMGVFAFISIMDAVLKLIIAFAITFDNGDRLIFYSFLMMLISILNLLLYYIYCIRHYSESKYLFVYNKQLMKDIFGYTSWTVVGQAAVIGTNQGNNILINIFHSVTANAAMGIAYQVKGAVVALTSNFQMAFNPQITKSYASKDYEYLTKLVFTTSKMSYIILLITSLPIMFNINNILGIWLVEIPPATGLFCILIIIDSILNALGAPFNYTALSSSKIKWFQIFTSIAFLSDLVILFPLFCLGFPAVTALIVKGFSMVLVTGVRVYFAHREVSNIRLKSFSLQVLLPLSVSTVLSTTFGLLMFYYASNIASIIVATLLLICETIICNWFVSLTTTERQMVKKYILRFVNRRINN